MLRKSPINSGCTAYDTIVRSCASGNGEAAKICIMLSCWLSHPLSRYSGNKASRTRRCAGVGVVMFGMANDTPAIGFQVSACGAQRLHGVTMRLDTVAPRSPAALSF